MINPDISISNIKKRSVLIPLNLWGVLIIFECIALYYFNTTRIFHIDEFESIHSGWKILNGETIYEEFIQQKNPALYYLLAIIVKIFGETINTIYASNFLIVSFTIGIFYYTYRLANLIFNSNTAYITLLLLPVLPWFVRSGYEVRPDVPMLFFSIASLFYLYLYLKKPDIKILVLSALFLVISFLFLQKAIFWFILLSAILVHRYLKGEIKAKEIGLYYFMIACFYFMFIFLISLNTSLTSYFFYTYKFVQIRQAALGGPGNIADVFNEAVKPGRYTWLILLALLTTIQFTRISKQQWEISLGAIWLLFTVFLVAQVGPRYFLPAMPLIATVISYGFTVLAGINKNLFYILIIILSLTFSLNTLIIKNENNLPGTVKHDRNKQMARVKYVLDKTNKDDYVYDGINRFNLFRKDLDFIWLGGHQHHHLSSVLSSIIPYQYNIYNLIYEKKPEIITHYYLTTTKYPWILKRYKKSHFFEDIYIKIKNNTGFDYWYTYFDSYGTGSEINPENQVFSSEGNIEVKIKKAATRLSNNGETYLYPYAGIGMQFRDPPRSVNLTDADHIILTYKLSGPISLLLMQEGISPGDEYRVNLVQAEKYTNLKLQWSDFAQPEWADKTTPLDLSKIKGVHFQVNPDTTAEADLGIQSIIFKGHQFSVN